MIKIDIPGSAPLELDHLVCDYNGTLAQDGRLLEGVSRRLTALVGYLNIHVVTGDTFGLAQESLAGLDISLAILAESGQREAKLDYVRRLGVERTVAIGNGSNDRDMLTATALGIAVLGPEGAAGATLAAATVVAPDILAALDLLSNPRRLVATLRQ